MNKTVQEIASDMDAISVNRTLDKEQARKYLEALFPDALNNKFGEIEVRPIIKDKVVEGKYYSSIDGALNNAQESLSDGYNVYVGVNPRVGKKGDDKSVKYIVAFYTDIDYGEDGHKRISTFKTYEEARQAIESFQPQPSMIVESGNGFHCYWIFDDPVCVQVVGEQAIVEINYGIGYVLEGDPSVRNLSRILRVPGTLNFKDENNPKPVTLISLTDKRYKVADLSSYRKELPPKVEKTANNSTRSVSKTVANSTAKNTLSSIDLTKLGIDNEWKQLIINGDTNKKYPSRSEADMAVIGKLMMIGNPEHVIKAIYKDLQYKIGEKYQTHPAPDKYFNHTVSSIESKGHILIQNGCIATVKGKQELHSVQFQEYMTHKYQLVMSGENIFRYDLKKYSYCSKEKIIQLCHGELGKYRSLFGEKANNSFRYNLIGSAYRNDSEIDDDQKKYIAFQNCLFNLDTKQAEPHTPEVFITDIFTYNYDEKAKCPRFEKFLQEIFDGDNSKIIFVQEMVGYILSRTMPIASMFYLAGGGRNGKTIFVNIISALFGQHNVCSVNLHKLANDAFLVELDGKMLNITSETPSGKLMNSDIVKAVTSGDWITGKKIYENPMRFRPYAKHIFAMNTLPQLTDLSEGMKRRIYILDFPVQFDDSNDDTGLEDKLLNELSGIFNWALEGYTRLNQNEYRFSQCQSILRDKEKYLKSMFSVREFIKNETVESFPKDTVRFKDLYKFHGDYCLKEGIRNFVSKKEFKEYLLDEQYIVEPSSADDNYLCVFGIKLK